MTEPPLTTDERDGIVLAAQSAFTKLKNLYREVSPVFARYGFAPPSAGVIARDLSEKIETAIIQHCESFSKGAPPFDLARDGRNWEVKVCKDSGLTINQSKRIAGESYIIVNYKATPSPHVVRVWVLWHARDEFFSARRSNSNARAFVGAVGAVNVEMLFPDHRRHADPVRRVAVAGVQPGLGFER